jgi:pimeloyl-ACP methyl ester carboxylesterase
VFDSREQAFAAYRGRGAFRTWPEAILADYLEDGLCERPDGRFELACAPAWEASNFAAQGHDPWRALGNVRAPIALLRAEHASTCRIGTGAGFARRGPPVTQSVVQGASHFLPMERPELVRETLLRLAEFSPRLVGEGAI